MGFPPAAPLRIVPASMDIEGTVSIPGSSARRLAGAVAHVALAIAALASAAAAQVVRGTVVDETSGRPVPGVVVVLFDSAGHRLAGVLAGDDGRYAIRTTGAGRFGLRTERIGFRADAPTLVLLSAGEAIEVKLVTRPVPVVLGEVRVAAKSPCVARATDGRELSAVWEEARKALYVTELTQRQELFSARVSRFVRTLDPRTRRVIGLDTKEASGVTRNPFVSQPAAELSAHGFVRQAAGEVIYYGPDAAVLLSDEFLGDHCFRLRAGDGKRSTLIGLEFEPVRSREKPDIAGTLWIDRKSAELRDLEYTYRNLTNLPGTVQSDDFGGQIAFRRMPTGAWIVERWVIRMPVLVDRGPFVERSDAMPPGMGSGRPERVQLGAIREEGGEVLETTARGARQELVTERATLRGSVFDSTRMAPLGTARVFLDGTQFSARSDADGSFTLGDVPEGTYTVSVLHPRFDSLGVKPPVETVTLRAGEPAMVRLAAPSTPTILGQICTADERAPRTAALRGRVVDAMTGGPAVDAEVAVSWTRLVDGGARPAMAEERRGTRTDADGRYKLCGLPEGARLTVRARRDGRVSSSGQALLPPDELSVLDLAIAATVVAAGAGTPSADTPRPSGATVIVTGPPNRVMEDVARRRRRGGGTYLTRTEISRRSASRLTDLLRTMPGVAIRPDENGVMIVELRGGPRVTLSPGTEPGRMPVPVPPPDSGGGGVQVPPPAAATTGVLTPRRCPAGLIIDGFPVDNSVGIDNADVQPENIEVIEVYSGAQVPIEYSSRHSSCGVVLVWTRAYADRPGP